MIRSTIGLVLLGWLSAYGNSVAADKPASIATAADVVIYRGNLNGKSVAWFGASGSTYEYAIDLNMLLPKAAGLKQSLLSTLAKDTEHRAKIVLVSFTPGENPPEPYEISIGKDVPLKVAQAVLGELSKLRDLKIALSVNDTDGQALSTRRVYIGSFKKSGKAAATSATLKSLLDPKLSRDRFFEIIQADE